MMLLDVLDSRIRRAFSDAAIQYDVLTGLHKEIGRELVKKVKEAQGCTHILDVGMGTGWLTNRIKHYFPEAYVLGIDFAEGMIDHAKRINEGFQIIQADALKLPFKEETFDLILSNLAFQWVANLTDSFKLCRACLKKDGRLSLTMFGQETLTELFDSIERSVIKKDRTKDFVLKRLASRKEIEAALKQAGFKNVSVDYERIKVHFPDMMALMQWVKSIGANNMERNIFIGKNLLQRANEYYEKHYRDRLGVVSTFEVVWVEAVK